MRRRAFLASAAGVSLSFGAGQPRSRAFKRSDVVFSFRFTPPEYQVYHATVLFGWAGAPASSDEIPKYREFKRQSLAVGVREGASISGFFGGTAWLKERERDWQESVWRNLGGNPITFPWVRPPEPFPPEKGEVCTNHPRFLEKKFAETDLAMAVQPYAFHVDDPLGTATELRIQGCFCKHCIAGFRTYLNDHTARDVTRATGIDDLDSFDYAKFLKGRSDRPFWYEWENFQLRSSVEHIRKIRQYAIR